MKLAKRLLENIFKSIGYEAGDVSISEDGHWHKTQIDVSGNGKTVKTLPFGDSEHIHEIKNWEVLKSDGHKHDKVEA